MSRSTFFWILALDLSTSVAAIVLYAWDKRAAKRRGRRVPESSLHLIALLGGWPGAALAQSLFRHKTQKRSFRRGFWLTVAANVILTVGILVWIVRPSGR